MASKGLTSAEDFKQFAMPMARRVYPNMIAQEIVRVQPMTSPDNNVLFMDFLNKNNLFNIDGNTYTEQAARDRFPFDKLVEAGVIGPLEAAKTILEKRNAR